MWVQHQARGPGCRPGLRFAALEELSSVVAVLGPRPNYNGGGKVGLGVCRGCRRAVGHGVVDPKAAAVECAGGAHGRGALCDAICVGFALVVDVEMQGGPHEGMELLAKAGIHSLEASEQIS